MWRRCGILIVAVLALGVCLCVQAEDASVLLEKGLYLEETAGDLDKAIEVYQQIIKETDANRRYVAEAYYRLGMCYLKKQDKDRATEMLGKVTAAYSDQTELAEAARAELAKLQPPGKGQPTSEPERSEQAPEYVPLNTVVERALSDQEFLNTETGQRLTKKGSEEVLGWALEHGSDLWVELGQQPRIAFIGMAVVPLEKDRFDKIGLEALALQIGLEEGILPDTYSTALSALARDREQLQAIEADLSRKVREHDALRETWKAATQKMDNLEQIAKAGRAASTELDDARLKVVLAERNFVAAEDDVKRLAEKLESLHRAVPDAENHIAAALIAGQARPLTERNQPAIQFRLLSQPLPLTYGFLTGEGSIGTLQVLKVEDDKVYIRYKMLSYGQVTREPARKVHLPGSGGQSLIVLNLSTGQLERISSDRNKYQEIFAGLQRRGGAFVLYKAFPVNEAAGLTFVARITADVPLLRQWGSPDVVFWIPDALPAGLTITVPSGDRYAIRVLEADNEGCSLEYRRLAPEEPVREPEGTRSVFLPNVRKIQMMLDLASGRLVPLPEGAGQEWEGDLVFEGGKEEGAFGFTRGVTADLPREVYYRAVPYNFVVTTGEGKQYAVSIRKADEEGCELVYMPLPPGRPEKTDRPEKDQTTPE